MCLRGHFHSQMVALQYRGESHPEVALRRRHSIRHRCTMKHITSCNSVMLLPGPLKDEMRKGLGVFKEFSRDCRTNCVRNGLAASASYLVVEIFAVRYGYPSLASVWIEICFTKVGTTW